MGMLNFFNKKNHYLSAGQHELNREKQLALSERGIGQLLEKKITPDSGLTLQFFFYAGKENNALALVDQLKGLNYEALLVNQQVGFTDWVVSGRTTTLKADPGNIRSWTTDMCDTGFRCDCRFEGWIVQQENYISGPRYSSVDYNALFDGPDDSHSYFPSLELAIPSGEIVCCDLWETKTGSSLAGHSVTTGQCTVMVKTTVNAEQPEGRRMLIKLAFTGERAGMWELATPEKEFIDDRDFDDAYYGGFLVPSGVVCLADRETCELLTELMRRFEERNPGLDFYDGYLFCEANNTVIAMGDNVVADCLNFTLPGLPGRNMLVLRLPGTDVDGIAYWGVDKDGEPCALVIDFFFTK